jgi:hypothetical protein
MIDLEYAQPLLHVLLSLPQYVVALDPDEHGSCR